MKDIAGRFGMSNHARQLRRHGDQKRLFTSIKLTAVALLYHHHAQQAFVVDNRYAKEGHKRIFPGLRQVLKTGMLRSIIDIQGFFAGTDEANKALRASKADLTHSVLTQTFGRHQNVALFIRLIQIY